jgi:plastocyanin
MHDVRRVLLILSLVAVLPLGAAGRAAADPECAPDAPPFDIQRPAGCQRIMYRYGPLHVVPGDNLILFGPVSIERPPGDGYVVRFKPDLVRLDGTVPDIDILHLHHAVWISTAFDHPMFASGEEKTIIDLPAGYGIPVRPWDVWALNYMLHNQTPVPENVYITYEIDFIPKASAQGITPVRPHWLNVSTGANPVYNTIRRYGGPDGECSYPRERCADLDPYLRDQPGNGTGDVTSMRAGTIVWMGGHVHPGGLRTEVDLRRGGVSSRVFTSDAVYFDPAGPVSWDMSMEVTKPSFRLRLGDGDQLVLNSVYDTAHGSWYEGMGIVVTFIAPADPSVPDAYGPEYEVVTHGHMPEASHHGGDDLHAFDAASQPDLPLTAAAAFTYLPGDTNMSAPAIPTVAKGTPFTFANLEPGGQIFHTFTACAAPCTGATGISYPLADGPVDFDSAELGLGPPELTAASNRLVYALPTAAMDPGTYTYFCRVHPFMRGAFTVS